MTPCGTVGYTAPEIVKDERYSKSVDMWALGCVLYTLLCGFPAFYDESIQTLTEKVARGQYTFLSPWWDDISKSAQDLVSHLLTVDPEKRYDINQFLNQYYDAEAVARRVGSADADILEEVIAGVREYFNKSLGRILLYRFERQQFYEVHKMIESGHGEHAGKSLCDMYGCEHLLRLFGEHPISSYQRVNRVG